MSAHPARAFGTALPRLGARRLVEGRARHVDDLQLPRMVHATFLRSPHAHARLVALNCAAARRVPGVFWVATGEDVAIRCQPFLGTLRHLQGMASAPQWPLVRDIARWQGEPVAMVIAASRALAEDAAQLIEVQWEPLPPIVEPKAALAPDAASLHPDLPAGNLAYIARVQRGETTALLDAAATRVAINFRTCRVTAVTLEPRGLVADWDSSLAQLTVYAGTQVPHMMQAVLAAHLGLSEAQVRVVALDTGGSFGLRIHAYPDEFAVAVAARVLGRPVKFVADRLESFSSDVHARGHTAQVEAAADAEGQITAFRVRDVIGIGPYSIFPRGSVNEARHVVNLVGAPYRHAACDHEVKVAFQNKAPYGQYRGVGHPIACLLTEVAVDALARARGEDPAAFRLKNLWPDNARDYVLPTGVRIEALSHEACLRKLLAMMDYSGLRAQQHAARAEGRHLGIGLACFVENSNHGTGTYGRGGAPIAAADGCTLRLQPDGTLVCAVSACDSGQGAETALAQIAAGVLGIDVARIRMVMGDTAAAPYGGGNWGSRGTGIIGEAVLRAAEALRANMLEAAAGLWELDVVGVTLADGTLRDVAHGRVLGTLSELAKAIYYRPDRFGRRVIPDPVVTRYYAQRDFDGGVFTNGVQASLVELRPAYGEVRLLRHWIVDDCGTVVNPMLADEQLRGGVVQGLGQALFEGCLYDEEGQLRNATLSEYLTPMAFEMPDVEVGHVVTPTATSRLGAKGVGEAGVTGAIAAVVNAVNDALLPFGGSVEELPITPDVIFMATGAIEMRKA